MTSSQPGTSATARMMPATGSGETSGSTASSRGLLLRRATGPSGRNWLVSTPYGTTVTDRRGTPSRVRSSCSPDELASTAPTLRAISASILIRRSRPRPSAAPAAAAARDRRPGRPPARRSDTPSVWKVCTTGTLTSRVAASAASPLVQ
jgi:hypothetical protein